jgi:hypothetical protein
MTFSRRGLMSRLTRTVLALATVGALGVASAQTAKPVKLMVGFPPAAAPTPSPACWRAAQGRTRRAGHRREQARRRRPDRGAGAEGRAGRRDTLFLSHDHTITILPMVMKNPGFDAGEGLRAGGRLRQFVNALAVSGGTPAKSSTSTSTWVRTQGGGKGSVGVPAPASVPEFLVKVIGEKYKLDLVPAPYRGSAPMMADMLGNQIAAGVGSVPDFIENHKAGKIRVVAVLGGARQAALPDVPTFSRTGPGRFRGHAVLRHLRPAGTPKATHRHLHRRPVARCDRGARGATTASPPWASRVGLMTLAAACRTRARLCQGLGEHHQEQRLSSRSDVTAPAGAAGAGRCAPAAA